MIIDYLSSNVKLIIAIKRDFLEVDEFQEVCEKGIEVNKYNKARAGIKEVTNKKSIVQFLKQAFSVIMS